MQAGPRSTNSARPVILNLLSDSEISRARTAETSTSLDEGDDYLDLERTDCGVRAYVGATPHMRSVLACKVVRDDTSSKILVQPARSA